VVYSEGVEVSSFYANALAVYGAGASATVYTSFYVDPNVPSGPNCKVDTVGSLFEDATAGLEYLVYVSLYDRFDNPIITPSTPPTIYGELLRGGAVITTFNGVKDGARYRIPVKTVFASTQVLPLALQFWITVGGTNALIAGGLQKWVVLPAELSLQRTRVISEFDSEAGVGAEIEVLSYDRFDNNRLPTSDQFTISVVPPVESNAEEVETKIVSNLFSNQYKFSYVATTAGFYTLTISADVPSLGGIVNLKQLNVYVKPTAYNRTTFSSEGTVGGLAGSTASVTFTAFDRFDNPSDDERLDLYVVAVTYKGAVTYYAASFVLDKETRQGVWRAEFPVPAMLEGDNAYALDGYYVQLNQPSDRDSLDPQNAVESFQYATELIFATNGYIGLPSSYIADNFGMVTGLTMLGIGVLAAFSYTAFRMVNYRKKFHESRKRADEAEAVITDLGAETTMSNVEMGGASIGGMVTLNPLGPASKKN